MYKARSMADRLGRARGAVVELSCTLKPLFRLIVLYVAYEFNPYCNLAISCSIYWKMALVMICRFVKCILQLKITSFL